MSNGFQRTLDHIRSIAGSESEKGRLFERLMQTYFIKDPLYKERFSHVWVWSEWAAQRPEFDGTDTGIDLVAEEREGGYSAIQCKCYAPGTQISKPHLDSFISASARDPFTARIVVDTGDGWGPNARKTIAFIATALRGTPLRGSREPTIRLAGSGPPKTGGAVVSSRAVQSAPASAGRVRGRDGRF